MGDTFFTLKFKNDINKYKKFYTKQKSFESIEKNMVCVI